MTNRPQNPHERRIAAARGKVQGGSEVCLEGRMTHEELLDSLTPEQRSAIADIIRSTDPSGDWYYNDGDGSFWQEDVSRTLDTLASYFDTYDSESAIG